MLVNNSKHFKHNVSIEILDPELARQWLSNSPGNRPIKPNHVAVMAADMLNGMWRDEIAEHMHFDEFGRLRNGHHRCLAVIKSGKVILVRVMRGLTDDEVAALDAGVPRSVSDNLAMTHDVPNANATASTVRALYAFLIGTDGYKLSTAETLLAIRRNPSVSNSVRLCLSPKLVNVGVLSAVHFVGAVAQGHPTEANEFVRVMKAGEPGYPGNPAHLLRERLIRDKGMKTTVRVNRLWTMIALAHAWTLFKQGATITKFQLPARLPHLEGLTFEMLFGPEFRLTKQGTR